MDVRPSTTLDRLQSDTYGVASAWSAPSAIGASVPGVGIQADAEATDFLIVLNTKSVSLLRPSDIPHICREAETHSPAGNCKGSHFRGLVTSR